MRCKQQNNGQSNVNGSIRIGKPYSINIIIHSKNMAIISNISSIKISWMLISDGEKINGYDLSLIF